MGGRGDGVDGERREEEKTVALCEGGRAVGNHLAWCEGSGLCGFSALEPKECHISL
jgi:hypothetical protein